MYKLIEIGIDDPTGADLPNETEKSIISILEQHRQQYDDRLKYILPIKTFNQAVNYALKYGFDILDLESGEKMSIIFQNATNEENHVKNITIKEIDKLYCYYTDCEIEGTEEKQAFHNFLNLTGLTEAFENYKQNCERLLYHTKTDPAPASGLYVVRIEETLTKCYIVKATDPQTARDIVKEGYDYEDIILCSDDFDGVSFTATPYNYGEIYETYPKKGNEE